MSRLIALDDGHGVNTPGKRTPAIPALGGRVIQENEFNKAVVKYLDEELRRSGFRTLLVAPTDADTSLTARVDTANNAKADAYISVHFDAFDGTFAGSNPEGHTIYVYTGHKSKPAGKLASAILKYLNQGTRQQNRGVKEANFQVLRETNMVAILSENGFMDNPREAELMASDAFRREVAIEHAKGICEYYGVAYVPYVAPKPVAPKPVPTNEIHRVQVGAFGVKANAEKLVAELRAKGYPAIIVSEDK